MSALMSTAPIEITLDRAPVSRTSNTWEIAVRFALVAIAVLICYQFEWYWLRYLTSELNLRLDALAGVHLQRLSHDTVMWGGKTYRYVNACTFADVLCGALPLLWNLRKNVWQNLSRFVIFGAVLIAFNVFRLSVSDVLYAQGLSWDLAHNAISGVSYFLVWTYLWKTRPF
jgi:hypothetical protein